MIKEPHAISVKYSYDVMKRLTEAADGERQECGILRIRCGRSAGTGSGLVNYSDPSGHEIKSKLKKAWGKATSAVGRPASTVGRAVGIVSTAASSIFKKAQSGLNKYMNSDSYKKYFTN